MFNIIILSKKFLDKNKCLTVKDGSSVCIDDENKIVYGLSDTPYCEDDILNNFEVVGTGVTAEIVPTKNG